MRFWICLALIALSAPAQQRFPIVELMVEGQEALPAPAILAESKLAVGQAVAPADLEAAVARLTATGFFSNVSYQYRPRDGGYVVRFLVLEQPMETAVRMEVPGVKEEDVWARLAAVDPLVQRRLPGTDAAEARYLRAMEQALAQMGQPVKLIAKGEVDLASGSRTMVFRPESLPPVKEVRFVGNQAVATETLEKAIARLTVGFEFEERRFREILHNNATPVLEDAARYAVAYPAIRTEPMNGGVAVTVEVREGPEYRLGDVTVRGRDLPADALQRVARFQKGSPARWREVAMAAAALEQPLRGEGYLDARATPERTLSDPATLHVAITVEKGPLFRFRSLRLQGLAPDDEQKVRANWKVAPGQPFRAADLQAFLNALANDRGLGLAGIKAKAARVPGAAEVDVELDLETPRKPAR